MWLRCNNSYSAVISWSNMYTDAIYGFNKYFKRSCPYPAPKSIISNGPFNILKTTVNTLILSLFAIWVISFIAKLLTCEKYEPDMGFNKYAKGIGFNTANSFYSYICNSSCFISEFRSCLTLCQHSFFQLKNVNTLLSIFGPFTLEKSNIKGG